VCVCKCVVIKRMSVELLSALWGVKLTHTARDETTKGPDNFLKR